MNRRLLATSLATVLIAMSQSSHAGKLTIYSGDYDAVVQSQALAGGPGYALVQQPLRRELGAGESEVQLAGLPPALDVGSVRLGTPAGVRVRAQRFDFAIAGQDELLRRSLGQRVEVAQAVGSTQQNWSGVLIAAGNGLTLRLDDGRIKVLADYSSFELPRLPSGIVNEPTLTWTLAIDAAGTHELQLDYATAGLAWRAEYQATLNGRGNDCRMDFEGSALVANRSGADFDDVALTLVAGQPNRQAAAGPQPEVMAMAVRAKTMAADGAPAPEASGEYHAYPLPGSGDVPQGAVQRLPLIDRSTGIACERRYETGQVGEVWRPPHPIADANFGGSSGQQPVIASLRFQNRRGDGLGVPLPAGRVRVFDGNDLLGEASLGHTAANQEVTLALGTVFDLNAERQREDFRLDRDGRTMQETVTVTLRNAKPEAATVLVSEQLPRWTDWEIVNASAEWKKTNAQSVQFSARVPAAGELRLSYTVRYRWPSEISVP